MTHSFPPYLHAPEKVLRGKYRQIAVFSSKNDFKNVDQRVVDSFGEEWEKFSAFSDDEIKQIGNQYFDIVSPAMLPATSKVLDVGCGSGRWSKYLLMRGIGTIDAVDPSTAIFSADELLQGYSNVRLTQATTENLPFADESFDFVMSIGVLHHIPDTANAMADCVRKVKPGGYFFTYLYYKVEHRGPIFSLLLALVSALRFVISRLPPKVKKIVCDLLAILIYMPFIGFGRLLRKMGMNKMAQKIPLQDYQNKTFFVIRNDALDRFGTILEQRFSRNEVIAMMEKCGLSDIRISEKEPWWHAVGLKNSN